jgi:phasin family protein
MAKASEAKFDAAEKAYAEAAAAIEPKAKTVKAPQVAAKVKASKKRVAAKTVAAKLGSLEALAPKAAIQTAKSAAAAKIEQPSDKSSTIAKLKETVMTTTEDFTAKIKDAVTEAQTKAKAAFEKSQAALGEYGEFAKGNLEAMTESGKVLAAGLQDMGKSYVAEGKTALETMTADVKELAAVKSPADFFKLQGEILRRNFDAVIAAGSKHSEATVKLANEAFTPIQSRVSLAMEKIKLAA